MIYYVYIDLFSIINIKQIIERLSPTFVASFKGNMDGIILRSNYGHSWVPVFNKIQFLTLALTLASYF